MTHILLTGAGFTRNWGGWLGKEIEGDLLGRLGNSPELRTLVQNSPNFEAALQTLQERRGSELPILERAVAASFREMNLALADFGTMEFSNSKAHSIQQYLSQFDAIFTLNQDLLFELHYDITLVDRRKHSAHDFPGLTASGPPGIDKKELIDRKRQVSTTVTIHDNVQPIFKLHGSVDWTDGSGNLFVVGGAKETYIQTKPILKRYFDYFRDYLSRRNARLMVIGYGRGDDHVNRLIFDASKTNTTLGIFHVHPDGRDAIHQGKDQPVAMYSVQTLANLRCIGESRRPLTSTFRDDTLELGKLRRFFG